MINMSRVTRRFGSLTAVDAVSLEVREGEIFGLVGPDGAGKTTLIRMLTGILAPTAGSIAVLGTPDLEAVKSQIGYVPQKFSLYGDLTVIENIRFIGALYGASRQRIEELATEILGFTSLLPFKDRLADNLSGGMKQKLSLAAGLMHRPRLLFLDEPTTGVDPVSRREFWQILYRLNKEGMTIFVSTPYMDEAELCTRVAFIMNGRIVSCAPPKELKRSYPFKILELRADSRDVRALLAGCPLMDINSFGDRYHLVTADPEKAAIAVAKALAEAGVAMHALAEIPPTLEDVFVNLAS